MHLLLSGDDEQILVGNFMGDFVKGRLDDRLPARIRQGVKLHRRIDSFAAGDPDFRRSRQRIAPEFGLFRGVLVDIFYDHILAASWDEFASEPRDRFLLRARWATERHRCHLPAELQRLVPFIYAELLPSYGSLSGIAAALVRMSRRIGHPNPLLGAERELLRLRAELETDFRRFLPVIGNFTEDWLRNPGNFL